jgi:phosphoribosylamine--glycine ligase
MKVGDEPYVVEYNVRMGDPETEVVLPRIKSDFVEILTKVAKGELGQMRLDINEKSATTVMLVSEGYPEAYEKGKVIVGLENISEKDAIVFHAGTKISDDKILSNGGRVLAVTALDENYKKALAKSYSAIKKICFDNIHFRTDIGFDLE